MFKKIIYVAVVALCLGLIGCIQSNEPILPDDLNLTDNDAPYRDKFINITYKGKEYLVAADYVCLAIKENYKNTYNDIIERVEKAGYEFVSAKPHYLRLLLRTDGKRHILEHYYKFEQEEYVEEVLPYVAVTI